jgi:hypothetical protein
VFFIFECSNTLLFSILLSRNIGNGPFSFRILPLSPQSALPKLGNLQEMDCLIATLSVDPVLKSHEEWIRNVVAHCDNKIEVKFLIVLEMLTEVFPKRTE